MINIQCLNVFTLFSNSTFDFQCIIHPTAHRGNINTAVKLNYLSWITAFLLASPLVYFSRITQLNHLQCTEKADNPTVQKFKVFYSFAALIIQYMTPLVIVTIVYYRICLSIRDRKLRAIQKMCLSQMVRTQIDHQNDKDVEYVLNENGTIIPDVKTHTNLDENTNHVCCLNHSNSPDIDQNHTNKSVQKRDLIVSPIRRTSVTSQKEAIDRRHRKAIILSTVIAIIFCLSWLPINTLNVISDIRELVIVTSIDVAIKNLKNTEFDELYQLNNNDTLNIVDTSVTDSIVQYSTTSLKAINKIMSIEANNIDAITVIITQALCLLLILSSACLNPILYGWLNKTFRMEFYQVLRIHTSAPGLQTIKSSNKNISLDLISLNKNNEIEQDNINNNNNNNHCNTITNDNSLNPTTIELHHPHCQHCQLSTDHPMNRVRFETRSLTPPTQDSCTLFSLFTSRSIELNSAPNSFHSGSISNTTPVQNSMTNSNYGMNINITNNNNNNNNNELFDKTSQTLMKYFQSKTEEEKISQPANHDQEIGYQKSFQQQNPMRSELVSENPTTPVNKPVNSSELRKYLLLNMNDSVVDVVDDDDECDVIPETDSSSDQTNLTNLRYLPDITSV
ncbi:unnamed protein product [Schistosoma turkestanicum]|nr:unnamed protein product [Schistosoma turkestanicum]